MSARSLTRLLSCQRQSFHFSSGTSAHSGARRLTAGRPSGPRRCAGSRRFTKGAVSTAVTLPDPCACSATCRTSRCPLPGGRPATG